jgi:LPXTG-motif cell wall-anchored protein
LGTVDVSFGETVTGGTNLTWLLGLAVPFVVLAGGVGVYLWRRSATG